MRKINIFSILQGALSTTMICGSIFIAQITLANPEAGVVTSGQIDIINNGTTATINQSTKIGVVEWQNFSIQAHETTIINQPSSDAITVNKVVSDQQSIINGILKAPNQGTVVITNPNGVYIGKNAVIDVGNLIATTSDVTLQDNNMRFTPSQNMRAPASIRNSGMIKVKDTGIAALVSPEVINDGVIIAKMGKVVLAGADSFTLNLDGMGLLDIELSTNTQKAIVKNNGRIEAPNGEVLITAKSVQHLVDSLIEIEENSVIKVESGKIIIGSSYKHEKQNTDKIKIAPGAKLKADNMKGKGGSIGMFAKQITIGDLDYYLNKLQSYIELDVSGKQGGSIRVGGDFQGRGMASTAEDVFVSPSVRIRNNAEQRIRIEDQPDLLYKDDKIIFWADNRMRFLGEIESKGLKDADGGLVEVSGKNHLYTRNYGYSFQVNTVSEFGRIGYLLLDPATVVIDNSSSTPSDPNNNSSTGNDIWGWDNNIGNVNADLTIAAHISITVDFGGSTNKSLPNNISLTLVAPTITLGNSADNDGMTASGSGAITLNASSSLNIPNNFTLSSSASLNMTAAAINIASGKTFTLNSNNVTVTTDSFTGTGSLGGIVSNSFTINPFTTNNTLAVGSSASGSLQLSDNIISSLIGMVSNSGSLVFGNNTTGSINISYNNQNFSQNLSFITATGSSNTVTLPSSFSPSKNLTITTDQYTFNTGDTISAKNLTFNLAGTNGLILPSGTFSIITTNTLTIITNAMSGAGTLTNSSIINGLVIQQNTLSYSINAGVTTFGAQINIPDALLTSLEAALPAATPYNQTSNLLIIGQTGGGAINIGTRTITRSTNYIANSVKISGNSLATDVAMYILGNTTIYGSVIPDTNATDTLLQIGNNTNGSGSLTVNSALSLTVNTLIIGADGLITSGNAITFADLSLNSTPNKIKFYANSSNNSTINLAASTTSINTDQIIATGNVIISGPTSLTLNSLFISEGSSITSSFGSLTFAGGIKLQGSTNITSANNANIIINGPVASTVNSANLTLTAGSTGNLGNITFAQGFNTTSLQSLLPDSSYVTTYANSVFVSGALTATGPVLFDLGIASGDATPCNGLAPQVTAVGGFTFNNDITIKDSPLLLMYTYGSDANFTGNILAYGDQVEGLYISAQSQDGNSFGNINVTGNIGSSSNNFNIVYLVGFTNLNIASNAITSFDPPINGINSSVTYAQNGLSYAPIPSDTSPANGDCTDNSTSSDYDTDYNNNNNNNNNNSNNNNSSSSNSSTANSNSNNLGSNSSSNNTNIDALADALLNSLPNSLSLPANFSANLKAALNAASPTDQNIILSDPIATVNAATGGNISPSEAKSVTTNIAQVTNIGTSSTADAQNQIASSNASSEAVDQSLSALVGGSPNTSGSSQASIANSSPSNQTASGNNNTATALAPSASTVAAPNTTTTPQANAQTTTAASGNNTTTVAAPKTTTTPQANAQTTTAAPGNNTTTAAPKTTTTPQANAQTTTPAPGNNNTTAAPKTTTVPQANAQTTTPAPGNNNTTAAPKTTTVPQANAQTTTPAPGNNNTTAAAPKTTTAPQANAQTTTPAPGNNNTTAAPKPTNAPGANIAAAPATNTTVTATTPQSKVNSSSSSENGQLNAFTAAAGAPSSTTNQNTTTNSKNTPSAAVNVNVTLPSGCTTTIGPNGEYVTICSVNDASSNRTGR